MILCNYCFNSGTVEAFDDEVPCPMCQPQQLIRSGIDPDYLMEIANQESEDL